MFPAWADGIGVCISLASILAIPGVAIYKVIKAMCFDNSGGLQKVKADLHKEKTEKKNLHNLRF